MLFKISLCFLLILVVGTFPSFQGPSVFSSTNDSADQITDDRNPLTSSISSCSSTFTVPEDSSKTPTFPVKQEIPNNFLLDVGLPGAGTLLSDGQTLANTMTSVTSTSASTPTSTPTSTPMSTPTSTPTSAVTPLVPVTPTSANAVTPAVMPQKTTWPSVITVTINPTMPITAVLPLIPTKPYSPSNPSSDPGTVVVIVNGPKSSNTKTAVNTIHPQSPNDEGIQSSSAMYSKFMRHGKIHCFIMRLGCVLLGLLVINIQHFGYF
ncbi:12323_t:CDS:2 [Dentiscutata heterogama]|uniref:12323_t:CDS:1 n=1 Tax=Dentiscutata heterogama TaxID=1316150 RepID=A0ACA9LLR7_9GLOM|nr:12323_t:CDS:2 [Dentiscutata heterogama]